MSVQTLVTTYEPMVELRNDRKQFWRAITYRARDIYTGAGIDGRDCPTLEKGIEITFQELEMVMYCYGHPIREELRRAIEEAGLLRKRGAMSDSEMDVWESIVDHNALVRSFGTVLFRILSDRLNDHDMSKLSPEEFEVFAEYFPKLRDSTYGSGEYKQLLEGMGKGLRTHYERNSHHPEHHPEGILDMNLIDFLEMVCDWSAAVHKHADGDLAKSIEINAERFDLGPQIRRILLNSVHILKYPRY